MSAERELTSVDVNVLQQVARQPDSEAGGGYLIFRNVVEWPLTVLLVLVAAPVIAVVAALAKLTSPGPAFYTQARLGRHGKPFTIYKIRTMKHNCESGTGAVWCAPNDVRMTKIGRFLRDTHLDELPQLLNVLQGHMSVIGPRPERPEMAARIACDMPEYNKRLLVRPGLTGLAQVRLPADLDVADVRHKLAYDLFYVRKVGLWMDLRVLFCTMLHVAALASDAVSSLLVKSYADAIERELNEAVGAAETGAPQAAPLTHVNGNGNGQENGAAHDRNKAPAPAVHVTTMPVSLPRSPSVRAVVGAHRAHASASGDNEPRRPVKECVGG